jgi:hypothetical protein
MLIAQPDGGGFTGVIINPGPSPSNPAAPSPGISGPRIFPALPITPPPISVQPGSGPVAHLPLIGLRPAPSPSNPAAPLIVTPGLAPVPSVSTEPSTQVPTGYGVSSGGGGGSTSFTLAGVGGNPSLGIVVVAAVLFGVLALIFGRKL